MQAGHLEPSTLHPHRWKPVVDQIEPQTIGTGESRCPQVDRPLGEPNYTNLMRTDLGTKGVSRI